MSMSSAPTTPEHAAARMRPVSSFRSHTVPSKLMVNSKDASVGPSTGPVPIDKDIEILYTCMNARIVSFNASSGATRTASNTGRGTAQDGTGSLSWASPAETTMAVGPMSVYRVISSGVAFLKSGSFLHPIMPMSQCWCVDGECKFVLRVRDGAFYRIELPLDTSEDKVKAEEMKTVLAKVLRYEKTACPFKRGFEVDISEDTVQSPSRIRQVPGDLSKLQKLRHSDAWLAEASILRRSSLPGYQGLRRASLAPEDPARAIVEDTDSATDESVPDETVLSAANEVESAREKPEIQERPSNPEPVHAADENKEEEEEEKEAAQEKVTDAAATVKEQPSTSETDEELSESSSPSFFNPQEPLRVQSMLEALPSLDDSTPTDTTAGAEFDSISIASSQSFYTAADEDSECRSVISAYEDALPTPRANNPPFFINAGPLPKIRHTRDASEVTVTSSEERPTTAGAESELSTSPPSTPTLIADLDDVEDPPWSDVITPPDTLRLRRGMKARSRSRTPHEGVSHARNISQALTVQSPYGLDSTSLSGRGKQLTAALIQKAYALLFSPPSHLVALMLRIAAKIANGASIFHSYDISSGRARILGLPNDASAPEVAVSSPEGDDWDEDDFGVPLSNAVSIASRSSSMSRGQGIITRGRQRTPSEIWGISSEEESPEAAIRRQELD